MSARNRRGGKYGGIKPTTFRTRPDGTRFPVGEVSPTIRNADIDAAVKRINERSNVMKEFVSRIVSAETIIQLIRLQDEVINSSSLDPYDQQVLIENVIDHKFSELMRAAGR